MTTTEPGLHVWANRLRTASCRSCDRFLVGIITQTRGASDISVLFFTPAGSARGRGNVAVDITDFLSRSLCLKQTCIAKRLAVSGTRRPENQDQLLHSRAV